MATLDISIIFFGLVISLLLTFFGIGFKPIRIPLFVMSAVYGVFFLGYVMTNYTGGIIIGTFSLPLTLFILAWIFLCVLVPSLLLVMKNKRY